MNDTCTNATAITSLPFSVDGNTTESSTTEKWWKFTVATSGNVTISLVGGTTNYDTYLWFYTGTDCNSLSEIDENDDYSDVQSQLDNEAVSSGSTYWIRVGGYSNNTGNYTLSVSGTATLSGGGPATAITMTGPTTGPINYPSTNFNVAISGTNSGVVVTPAATGGGTFSPTSVTLSTTTQNANFTYTATSSGSHTISVTNNGSLTNPSTIAYNAVATSGSAVRNSIDTTTQGSWIGVYGSTGYWLANDAQSLPGGATVTFANQTAGTWTTGTSVRYLQRVSPNTDRIASYWYNNSQFTMTVTVTSPRILSLYFLDYDPAGRAGTIKVYDTNNNIVLFSDTISSFSNGIWWRFTVTGTVKFEFTATSSNFTMSGLMFDNPNTPATQILLTAPATAAVNFPNQLSVAIDGTSSGVTVSFSDNSGGGTFSPTSVVLSTSTSSANFTYTPASTGNKILTITNNGGLTNPSNYTLNVQNPSGYVTLVDTDYYTQGTWKGTYGTDGYIIVNDSQSLPSYATYTAANNNTYTWNSSTGIIRATQKGASTTDRIISGWYNNTEFTVNFTVSGTAFKDITMYFLDADGGRSLAWKAEDTSYNLVLASGAIAAGANNYYYNGTWLRFRVKGTIRFRFTSTGNYNSTLNAVMFDPTPGAATSLEIVGPNAGSNSATSTNFTVTLKPNIAYGTTNTTVTPVTDLTGTFSPTTVVLNDSNKSAIFSFTPSVTGEHRISTTNNNSLTNSRPWGYASTGSVPSGINATNSDHQYTGVVLYETNSREANSEKELAGPLSVSFPAGAVDLIFLKTSAFLNFM